MNEDDIELRRIKQEKKLKRQMIFFKIFVISTVFTIIILSYFYIISSPDKKMIDPYKDWSCQQISHDISMSPANGGLFIPWTEQQDYVKRCIFNETK